MKRKYRIGNGNYWARRDFRRQFDGSDTLFDHCWKKFLENRSCFDGAEAITDFLEQCAAEAVNNEKSPFYIHG